MLVHTWGAHVRFYDLQSFIHYSVLVDLFPAFFLLLAAICINLVCFQKEIMIEKIWNIRLIFSGAVM